MSTHPQSPSFMHMKSVSEADESLFKPILRAPYLQVTVVKMCNLEQLEQHNLEPYLVLTHGESRFETSVLVSGEQLMQTFEVDIVHLQPLGIFVMDKDDYGKHSVISSLLVPAFYFAKWVGKTHEELCIRIEPSDLSESEDSEPHTYTLSDDLLLTDGERLVQPHLHLRILVMDESALSQLRVSITEHRIRSTVTETFTQYAAEVIRGDGMKWYTKLRYSQISALRKSLIGTFPEFEKTRRGINMWDLAVTALLLGCGYIVYSTYGFYTLLAFIAASYIVIWLLPQVFGYYPIQASDVTWFHDNSVSKIHIQSCVVLDRMPAEEFLGICKIRGPGVHPRFRLCIRRLIGKLYWKQEKDFSVEKHFVVHEGEVKTRDDLFHVFETYYQRSVDFRKSPWELYYIEKYGSSESAFFFKSHHILGDGLAMVSLVVNLSDPFQDSSYITIPRVRLWEQMLYYVLAVLKSPIIAYYTFTRKEDNNCFHGPQLTGVKHFFNSEPWKIAELKAISKREGVSLNTLIMSCVAGALRKYAKSKGEDVSQLTMLLPYSMRMLPTDGSLLPMTNSTSVLVFPLNISTADSRKRIKEYHQYNEGMKRSIDPFANNITLKFFGGILPLSMLKHVIYDLNRKITFNFTNVPGPSCQLRLNGKKVNYICFAAPCSGKVGFCVSCFSYNQTMIFGCCSDTAVMKDPNYLVRLIEQEIEDLKS